MLKVELDSLYRMSILTAFTQARACKEPKHLDFKAWLVTAAGVSLLRALMKLYLTLKPFGFHQYFKLLFLFTSKMFKNGKLNFESFGFHRWNWISDYMSKKALRQLSSPSWSLSSTLFRYSCIHTWALSANWRRSYFNLLQKLIEWLDKSSCMSRIGS